MSRFINIKEAKILWETGDLVKITSINNQETEEESNLPKSFGACNADFKLYTDPVKIECFLAYFIHLTVAHNISPKKLFSEYLKIKEIQDIVQSYIPNTSAYIEADE